MPYDDEVINSKDKESQEMNISKEILNEIIKELSQRKQTLLNKENEIKMKEDLLLKNISNKETELASREKLIAEREDALNKREQKISQKEDELTQREKRLEEAEQKK